MEKALAQKIALVFVVVLSPTQGEALAKVVMDVLAPNEGGTNDSGAASATPQSAEVPPLRLRLFAAYRQRGGVVKYPADVTTLHRSLFGKQARSVTPLYHGSRRPDGFFSYTGTPDIGEYRLAPRAIAELDAWESAHGPIV